MRRRVLIAFFNLHDSKRAASYGGLEGTSRGNKIKLYVRT
jgi:hypothetical protein